MPEEQWRQLLATHLGGTVNALTAVVPGMVAAHRGTVVTTSSWLALAGLPGETYYAAATGTVLALTKSFAVEIAPHGVRMNCVAVGPLATGDTQETPVGGVVLPLGRYATADDVAATVEFLIHEGDFYVGQIFEPSAGVVV
jgi:NAD(P)-dependent dehydrogenase (short-subunit alcohol dehydrogenase family)